MQYVTGDPNNKIRKIRHNEEDCRKVLTVQQSLLAMDGSGMKNESELLVLKGIEAELSRYGVIDNSKNQI